MKTYSFVCLLLLSAAVFGQSTPTQVAGLSFLAPKVHNSGGKSPVSVAVADLNGDGKPDLVVANLCPPRYGCNGEIGVLLRQGYAYKATVGYSTGGMGQSYSVAVADLNGDGKPDIIVTNNCGNANCSVNSVGVLLGNGDGTFQPAVIYEAGGFSTSSVTVADMNGDGKPDLVVASACAPGSNSSCFANSGNGVVSVLPGNGDGSFQTPLTFDSGGIDTRSAVAADVNGDGKLDVVIANCSTGNGCGSADGSVSVLLGNGDGTLRTATTYNSGGIEVSEASIGVAVGDVNGDGKPDLVATNTCVAPRSCSGGGSIGVLIGNGDGTFQAARTFGSGEFPDSVALVDVNGDGKLDAIVADDCSSTVCPNGAEVAALLGNGDGTFQAEVTFPTGGSLASSIAVADLDGNRKPDIVVTNEESRSVSVLFNESVSPTALALTSSLNPSNFGQTVILTATLTAQPGFFKGALTGTVDFFDQATNIDLGSIAPNSSGVEILQTSTLGPSTHSIIATYSGDANFLPSKSSALSQVVLGAAAKFSASALNFGYETVGNTSATQTVFLINTGDIPLNFTSITMGGLDPGDFRQTNSCSSSLAGQASCIILIDFTPSKPGARSAAVIFMDNAPSKVQRILLTGLGVLPSASFSSTSLTFPSQVIYTTSLVKTVRLNNVGLGILKISTIEASGPFHQTNDCGSTVGPGSGCTITVTFRPTTIGTLTGALSVTDNAPGSPQKVGLSGTGTAVKLTPVAIGFGDQPVRTTSLAKTITLSNKSHATVNIMSIAITGPYRDDFSETNTCGTSITSGASCFIKVKFTPTGKRSRTAAVSITDDGGGSPQRVGLAGSGT